MKNFTKIILSAIIFFVYAEAAAQCVPYYTTNSGWSASEYFKIIDIDAEKLTTSATSIPTHDKTDGTATSSLFGSGAFTTPILTTEDGVIYTETSVLWPVKYYMACIAPNFYNSAYTKVVVNGTNPSGAAVNCTFNDNNTVTSPIWSKKGFIELSRLGSEVANTPPSRHGYIQIDDLPQVERIQWSFSSTAYKRGVKCDIKYGDGEWQPLRWEASNNNSYATFSEQGYQFEELINKGEDPESKISLRWRIWDGDSIHFDQTKAEPTVFTTTNSPYAQQQVVRIHQIRIYSGVVPTTSPNAVNSTIVNNLKIYRSGDQIVISEKVNAELFNIVGKKVYAAETNKIDINGFEKGVYILKARNSIGKIQNQKIVLR